MANNHGIAIRIGTLNVRGLTARRRQAQLSRLMLENDIDILAVQETKIESEEQTDKMVQVFKSRYNTCVCHGVGKAGGCLLFLRNSIGIVAQSVMSAQDGRLVLCDFSFNNIDWRIVCVYAPNKISDRKFFLTLLSHT